MNRMLQFTILLACAGLSAIAARAEPYWVSYDGTDFPENQGWSRLTYAGGAERWLEEGSLVLDGREDVLIADAYSMSRPIDPGPDELFIMRWRLRVDEVSARVDPAVVVFSDDSWGVGFEFSESSVESAYEIGMSALFEPGIFHVYELRSFDMRHYELLIDDEVVLVGLFYDTISSSKVGWGDGVVGSASLSRWDYYEFGVVPEPSGAVAWGVAGAIALFTRRRDL